MDDRFRQLAEESAAGRAQYITILLTRAARDYTRRLIQAIEGEE
jgi:hypothetical protein